MEVIANIKCQLYKRKNSFTKREMTGNNNSKCGSNIQHSLLAFHKEFFSQREKYDRTLTINILEYTMNISNVWRLMYI